MRSSTGSGDGNEMVGFTNTVMVRCAAPRARVSGGVPQSGLWSEKRGSPRSGVYGTRAEPGASGREVASVADAEAPREHLAPEAACGYVAVIME
jgi:hypothetical protein